MNGGELPVAFGGPLRLRVPRQLGYKSVKYITRLTITDSLKRVRQGPGLSVSGRWIRVVRRNLTGTRPFSDGLPAARTVSESLVKTNTECGRSNDLKGPDSMHRAKPGHWLLGDRPEGRSTAAIDLGSRRAIPS